MAAQTLKLAGKEFVIVPASEYRALARRAGGGMNGKRHASLPSRKLTAQDRGDIAESIRRRDEPTVPLAEAMHRAGL